MSLTRAPLIGRAAGALRSRRFAALVGVPLVVGALAATTVDPQAPLGSGRERVSAVLLLDGSAYFGHLRDVPWSDSVELTDVYYLQDARAATTNLALALVRRGSEAHAPADGMRIRRDKILAIEQVGSGSAVLGAIASQRTLDGNVR